MILKNVIAIINTAVETNGNERKKYELSKKLNADIKENINS
jgi:hypothetical protein